MPFAGAAPPAAAADLLEIQLEGLQIPLRLDQLEIWSRAAASRAAEPVAGGQPQDGSGHPAPQSPSPPIAAGATADRTTDRTADPTAVRTADPMADQEVWLNLLEPGSRRDLMRLLRAPLLRDRSFGSQLLDSWAGRQMLAEVGVLLTGPDGGSTAPVLQSTLRRLLREQREVTTLTLLRELPLPTLHLRLDSLLALAQRWRGQIEQQSRALAALQDLQLTRRRGLAVVESGIGKPRRVELAVAHRIEPLPLDLWPGQGEQARRRPWLLVLPGLGGNADQLGWFAGSLAERGWSVVVSQHPGSDGPALKAALDGQIPPPGAESLAIRLRDVEAVLQAHRQGRLALPGQGLVLVGHSLGGLSALMAAGLQPQDGLAERCRRAIDRLPLGNPSRLLQCELVSTGIPAPLPRPADLRGVMLFNSFGSLLWPQGVATSLSVPVLMVGGSLDLVTPPLEEQLNLFLPAGHPRNRLVLVEGGSHFSPVRMQRQEAVLRLGQGLVGADPETVQSLLLELGRDYLLSLETPLPLLPAQVRLQQGVRAYVLDAAAARRWRRRLAS